MRINDLVAKLKSTTIASTFLAGILLFPRPILASTVDNLVNPQSYGWWVLDQAGILSDSTEATINDLISELAEKKGSEIVVVTVRDTASSPTPQAFTEKLFRDWHMGQKNAPHAILYLISVDDRRVEIETDYRASQILPEAKIQHIIETKIIPRYKNNNYDAGTLAGVKAIVNTLDKNIFNLPEFYITLLLLTSIVSYGILFMVNQSKCPQCQKLFSIKAYRKIKQKRTDTSPGIYYLNYQCRHCSHLQKVEQKIIPSFKSSNNEFFSKN